MNEAKKFQQQYKRILRYEYKIKWEVPIQFICFNNHMIYKPKSKFLNIMSDFVTFSAFESLDYAEHFYHINISDIKLIRYSLYYPILCITLTNDLDKKEFGFKSGDVLFQDSIWFCLDVPDIKSHKIICISLVIFFLRHITIKTLSHEDYELFKNSMYINEAKIRSEFISDWSSYLTPIKKSLKRRFHIEKHGKGLRSRSDIIIYEPEDGKSVTLMYSDLDCLRPKEFLNNDTVEFYLTYIYHHFMSEEFRRKSFFYPVLFYTHLNGSEFTKIDDTAQNRHSRVAHRTKNVDIFSKDYLVIPMKEGTHWFLMIVCFPWMAGMMDYDDLYGDKQSPSDQIVIPENCSPFAIEQRYQLLRDIKLADNFTPMPCILVFDSFIRDNRYSQLVIIREYLQMEWNERRAITDGCLVFNSRTCRGYSPRVPRQRNIYESGIYMLHYVETFFTTFFPDYSRDFFKSELLDFVYWFYHDDINGKRRKMRYHILKLAKTLRIDRENNDSSS